MGGETCPKMEFTSLSGEQRLDIGPVKKVMGNMLAILFRFFFFFENCRKIIYAK